MLSDTIQKFVYVCVEIDPVPLRQFQATVAFEKWRTNLPSCPSTALQLPSGSP